MPARGVRCLRGLCRCLTTTARPLRCCSTGQVVDVQADHCSFDDGEGGVGCGPGGAVGQLGVEPVPGACGGGAVEAGVGDGFGVRSAPGVGLAEDELASVPGRSAHGVWLAGRDGPAQDSVRSHPGQDLHGQVAQEECQARRVVSGVRKHDDVRVARLPLPRRDQSLQQITQLPGGDGGGVVPGFQAECVQGRGPGAAARLERADDRVGPAGDGDVLVLASAVGVAQDPLW
ncbi:hypothetical protein QF027_008170 [Streptomyces canus]|nr:hypothetical protein [Streptomyces canus]